LKSVTTLFGSIFGYVPAAYLLLDGYFGNKYYVNLAKVYHLDLISKLKSTAALYFPYQGGY